MPDWVNAYNITAYLQAGLLILLVVIVLVQQQRLRVAAIQLQRHKELLKNYDGNNLEDITVKMRVELNQKGKELANLTERLDAFESKMPDLVQNIGVIRFKGFEDVGGDLSFSTAILTGQGDGVVITALHARDDTRIYAKKVEKYVSAYPLSEEEINAIKQSQKR
ncbi:MAG: DUF4446 family protein [Methanomassiliicoccales archaeon]